MKYFLYIDRIFLNSCYKNPFIYWFLFLLSPNSWNESFISYRTKYWFLFSKKKEKREKITPRERKERVSSKSNSKWKIVKKGGEKRKQNAYQRELMKMAGYRGTNEIAGVLGCAATRLARNVDEVKRSQGNWRTFQM